jgi:hypothetical protein
MPDRDLIAEGRAKLAALAENPATDRAFDLAEWAGLNLAALLDELEAQRERVNELSAERRNPDEDVLVEGSWFHPEDLPTILGNYMRSVDEHGRRWKDAVVENKALRARIAELDAAQRPPLGYVAMGRPKDSDTYGILIGRNLAIDKLSAEMQRQRFSKDEDLEVVVAEIRVRGVQS